MLVLSSLLAAGCGSEARNAKPGRVLDQTRALAIDPARIQGTELAALPTFAKPTGQPPRGAISDARYLAKIFEQAQTMWDREISAAGFSYTPARLVFFTEPAMVHSPCHIQAQAGPFYCGADHAVHLDRRFLELVAAHIDGSSFAGAYLVSQLLGRHVQRVIGIGQRVSTADRWDPAGRQTRTRKVELQADCLSGVWAHSIYTRAQLTSEDVDHALNALTTAGRDFEAEASDVRIDPSLWSQPWQLRAHWFDVGFDTANPAACNTFTAAA